MYLHWHLGDRILEGSAKLANHECVIYSICSVIDAIFPNKPWPEYFS